MTIYTCDLGDAEGTEVQVDSSAPGQYVGQTLSCWVPPQTWADRQPVTFVEPTPVEPVDPRAARVAAFLGEGDDSTVIALAEQALPLVEASVRAYTRGRGFTAGTPNDDLEAVIIAAAARLAVNPALHRSETVGDYTANYGGFIGFTLPELSILNRYRERAR